MGYQAARLGAFDEARKKKNEKGAMALIELREVTTDDGRMTTAIPAPQLLQFETSFLYASLQLFYDWKRFKTLPHGGGTMAERQSVLDILTVLDVEAASYERWEMERRKAQQSPRPSHAMPARRPARRR